MGGAVALVRDAALSLQALVSLVARLADPAWRAGDAVDALLAWLARSAAEGLAVTAAAALLAFFALVAQRAWVAAALDAIPDHRRRLKFVAALRDARRRVVGYFAVMSAMNLLLAATIGVALAAIGVAHAVLWAAPCSSWRSCLISARWCWPRPSSWPATGATHWVAGLAPAAAFLALHAVEGNFLNPWLMGQRLRVSRVALLVAVLIGGWAWG